MKVWRTAAGLAVVILLAAGCGSGDGTTPVGGDVDEIAASDGDLEAETQAESDAAEEDAAEAEPEAEAEAVVDSENGERPPPVCPPVPPYGCGIGDSVQDFRFTDCTAAEIALHDLCGSNAVLVYNFYGWCGACFEFMRNLGGLYDAYHAMGLETVFIISQDSLYQPATTAYCLGMQEQFSIPGAVVIDPDGTFAPCGAESATVILNESLQVVFHRDDAAASAVTEAVEAELGR